MTAPDPPRLRIRRVRLADVAAHAKVSTAAASIALNDRPGVSDAVRQRVRDAAATLGYRSDRLAASLRTGRTSTLGLVMRNIGNPHYAEMIAVIERECARSGLGIVVASSGFDRDRERAAVHDLIDRGIDLLAVTPVGPVDSISRWGPIDDIPLVLVDTDFSGDIAPGELDDFWSRTFDNEDGIRQSVEHLAALGHRHLALISLTSHPTWTRIDTFTTTSVSRSMRAEIVEAAAPTVTATREAIAPLFDRPIADRPSALIFGSDDTALAGYMVARDYGLRIPDDLSLIGSGALRTSAFLDPALTSVDAHPRRMGEAAARLILDIHTGADRERRHERLAVRLLAARSTGPADAH